MVLSISKDGDNFDTRGIWNILEGQCWVDWQCAAQEAHIRAAEAQSDTLTARRFERELKGFRAAQQPGGRAREN